MGMARLASDTDAVNERGEKTNAEKPSLRGSTPQATQKERLGICKEQLRTRNGRVDRALDHDGERRTGWRWAVSVAHSAQPPCV
jgi:hypothetical protein